MLLVNLIYCINQLVVVQCLVCILLVKHCDPVKASKSKPSK